MTDCQEHHRLEDISHQPFRIELITMYFKNEQEAEKAGRINHGFTDLNPEVPTFREFFKRTRGEQEKYKNYTTYLLTTEDTKSKIIGVLAVQRVTRKEITEKLMGIEPPFKGECIYLSWIVIEKEYQHLRLFKLLFSFYESLLKRLAKKIDGPVYGALIGIRRLRKILYLISGTTEPYNKTTTDMFKFAGNQIELWGVPIERINNEDIILKDHYYVRIISNDIQYI